VSLIHDLVFQVVVALLLPQTVVIHWGGGEASPSRGESSDNDAEATAAANADTAPFRPDAAARPPQQQMPRGPRPRRW
jgi:hypothetical protein